MKRWYILIFLLAFVVIQWMMACGVDLLESFVASIPLLLAGCAEAFVCSRLHSKSVIHYHNPESSNSASRRLF